VLLSYFLLELEEKNCVLTYKTQFLGLTIQDSGYSTKSGSKPKTKLNDSTRHCSGGVFYAKRCVSQLLTVPTT
jgi:hypothetical protein